MSEQEKNSIVDDRYYQLYGEHQAKEGQSQERQYGQYHLKEIVEMKEEIYSRPLA